MDAAGVSTVYELGPFRLHPRAGVLTREGAVVPLGPRAVAVLTVLVEDAQAYVAKERILEAAWPGVVVEEGNLAVQISAIRRALASAPGSECWVETLSRRGYRFVGPVIKRTGEPTGAAPSGVRARLPRALTSFVGREHELEEIQRLLSRGRLVTIVGMGGIGKTRLATQLAARIAYEYPDGVFFVDLGALVDERLVPEAVASALGVNEVPGEQVRETLLKYVDSRALLLVLDNCEHVLSSCAAFTKELLNASDRASVLATSREVLHITGEVRFVLSPLAIPETHELQRMPGLLDYPAVRLFCDRATAAQPHFRFTAKNAAAVVDICRRLEGIPLAIELAAARTKILLPEKIAERLHDRFRLLQSGDTTAPYRLQTLRASIDWSNALLTRAEHAALRRLAVFAGTWTLEAAEAVVADVEVERGDVLGIIGSLVEKSLVQFDDGVGRYRLLETVRLYAFEKLVDIGEEFGTRLRHVDFYLGSAERREVTGTAAAQEQWIASIELEHENLLSAHNFCCRQSREPMRGLRLVAAMFPYWFHRGLLGLGYRVTSEALSTEGARAPSEARCRALFAAGLMGRTLGCHEEARALIEECVSIARALHDERRVALALSLLRNCAIFSLADY